MVNIMIADDNVDFSKSLCNMLTKEKDFRISNISCNGLEALVSYTSLNPDVLILDLDMPGFSGLDFLNTLKSNKQYHKSNIIIISGSVEHKILLSDVSLIKYIFQKPFDFNNKKLFEIIREIKKESFSDSELNNKIYKLLEYLDFNMYSKGTMLLVDSIKLAYSNSEFIFKTENLMKEVSKVHNSKNFTSTRSTIDKSILSMYKSHMDLKKICEVFPNFYGYKPTIKNFISNAVNYLNSSF